MAKCTVCLDFDNKMNRVDPCENTGWPELDDLCPDHFREFLIQPAINRAYEAENHVTVLQDRLYDVEVAMRLRSKPYPSTVGGSANGPAKHDRDSKHVTSSPSQRVRPSFVSRNIEDLEEME